MKNKAEPLLSFHGKQETKEFYLTRLQAHYDADEFIKGKYWEGGKGCAVGCTIHSDKHMDYETELGIPQTLAYLEDRIFENLPNAEAKEWPLQFLNAIPVGVDLKNVYKHLMIWILVDEKEGVIQYATNEEDKIIIQAVADTFTTSLTKEVPTDVWFKLKSAASAAASAASAAYTAYAAASAAYTAYAVSAASAAGAVSAAVSAARSDKYISISKKLLKLLSEAK